MMCVEAYKKRLDLLLDGYVKQNSNLSIIPIEIIDLIKIWHSNDETPKLILNLLSIELEQILFECYFDKNHWNILDINKYTLSYEITTDQDEVSNTLPVDQQSRPYWSNGHQKPLVVKTGEKDITHFYDAQNLVGFVSLKEEYHYMDVYGKFTLYAKDFSDDIVASASITTEIDFDWGIFCDPQFELIDVNDNQRVVLNEWMRLRKQYELNGDDLLWKRIFYFGNFIVG